MVCWRADTMASTSSQPPTLAINGERLVGACSYATLRTLVDAAISAAKASGVAHGDYYQLVVSP